MKKILVTAPPMAKNVDWFTDLFGSKNMELHVPVFEQKMQERSLVEIIGNYDGWIIGDDPVTHMVLKAGRTGKLRCAVRWGVGMDNIDSKIASQHGYIIKNTPNAFGDDASEIVISHCLALARSVLQIDREVRKGNWFQPTTETLSGKNVGIIGYGSIGKDTVFKLNALGCKIKAIYDPNFTSDPRLQDLKPKVWPTAVEELDYLIVTASLNKETKQMITHNIFNKMKNSSYLIINSRGAIVNEDDLYDALKSQTIKGAALEVMEHEPLRHNSKLLKLNNLLLGSHNASNTKEGIHKATNKVFEILEKNLT